MSADADASRPGRGAPPATSDATRAAADLTRRQDGLGIRSARPEDLPVIAALIDEYEEWLVSAGLIPAREGNDFAGAGFPAMYSPPGGCVLVAEVAGAPAGCVALRPLADPGACEMKKLFVRPVYRASGAGRALVAALLEHACAAGYDVMRLDTLPRMSAAIRMYQQFGFTPRGPYHDEHPVGALYFERRLGATSVEMQPHR